MRSNKIAGNKFKLFRGLRQPIQILLCLLIASCSTTPNTSSKASNSKTPVSTHTGISKTKAKPSAASEAASAGAQLDRLYTSDDGTIWARVRGGYQLNPAEDHALIDEAVVWYRKNPTYFYRTTERSNRYLHYVVSALEQRNMPTELALLPFLESACDPFAYSRSGAAGMWQFVPRTATAFGLERNWWYDGRKDVVASTDAALTYLQYLHDKFNDDWLLAVAAYNFGEGSIQRAMKANELAGKPTDFWSLNVREETRTYVPRLLAIARIVAAPHKYGINLHAVPDKAYFAAVDTGGPLTLARAAEMAAVDIDELQRLNPALNHGSIGGGVGGKGPSHLLVPVDAVDRFSRELAQLPADKRSTYRHYDVAKGDTLSGIARKFGVSTAAIQNANALGNNLLKPGQALLIPSGAETARTTASPASPSQTPSAANQVFHTVAAGDNLGRLAQRYGVSTRDIQRWNGLDSQDPIRLGQKLNIWTEREGAPARTVATDSAKRIGYTVKSGDSLIAIADRFDIEIDD